MIMSVRHYDLLRAPRTGEVADVINVSRVRVKPNRLIDKDDSNTITISTEDNIYIDDNPAVDIQNENNDILSEIKNWALTENVTAKAVKSLLLIMRKYFKHLPTDPRTLLSTPRST
ncbi:Uncharacterized protein FWK35_00030954 [Aphis craccivora]|uniref:Uncharacterized protein n=1 Tax=Aphis craccivora TaxID=307492 RepID=A0A6G0VZZ1_APHCR|nr:Uncharacterized protein FWK35_00030954 [Aphis craccivora]